MFDLQDVAGERWAKACKDRLFAEGSKIRRIGCVNGVANGKCESRHSGGTGGDNYLAEFVTILASKSLTFLTGRTTFGLKQELTNFGGAPGVFVEAFRREWSVYCCPSQSRPSHCAEKARPVVKVTKPSDGQAITVELGHDQPIKIDLTAIAGENFTLARIGESSSSCSTIARR